MTTPSAPPMSADEFNGYMDILAESSNIISALPLDALLHVISVSQTLAPIFRPTEYRDGGARNLADQEALLRRAIALRATVQAIGAEQS